MTCLRGQRARGLPPGGPGAACLGGLDVASPRRAWRRARAGSDGQAASAGDDRPSGDAGPGRTVARSAAAMVAASVAVARGRTLPSTMTRGVPRDSPRQSVASRRTAPSGLRCRRCPSPSCSRNAASTAPPPSTRALRAAAHLARGAPTASRSAGADSWWRCRTARCTRRRSGTRCAGAPRPADDRTHPGWPRGCAARCGAGTRAPRGSRRGARGRCVRRARTRRRERAGPTAGARTPRDARRTARRLPSGRDTAGACPRRPCRCTRWGRPRRTGSRSRT